MRKGAHTREKKEQKEKKKEKEKRRTPTTTTTNNNNRISKIYKLAKKMSSLPDVNRLATRYEGVTEVWVSEEKRVVQ